MTRLVDLATTVRSKNAGVDHVTFDIIFTDERAYRRVVASGVLTRESVARLYGVPAEDVTHFHYVDAARAIKFTLRRRCASGSPGESDVFGSQQYPPLFDVEIPDEMATQPADALGAQLRRRLARALRDPQRRQLAHIAVLDVAMAVREALERRGVAEAEIGRVTEEISAFLTGESDRLTADALPGGEVAALLWDILASKSREPAFARVFGPLPEEPHAGAEEGG